MAPGGRCYSSSSTTSPNAAKASRESAGKVPAYDGNALAREVFADPYFYYDNAIVAEQMRPRREAIFRETTTVDQVRREYSKKEEGLTQLGVDIGANPFCARDYLSAADVAIEQLLAQNGVVALNEERELARFEERVVDGLPAFEETLSDVVSTGGRSTRICFVRGSSGSGKTFFAMRALRTFLRDERKVLPSVVIYLHPANFTAGPGGMDFSDSKHAPAQLAQVILQELNQRVQENFQRTVEKKLAMHACVVLDEASAPTLRAFFETKGPLDALYRLLSRRLAESLTLVVVGTGAIGSRAYKSQSEAYVFRMKQWGTDDFKRILLRLEKDGRLELPSTESVDLLNDAVYAHPLLGALTTNGRSAYFLADTIARISSSLTARRTSWYSTLADLTPSLIEQVVLSYTSSNGIWSLRKSEQARVAAWTFRALENTKGANFPELDGLDDDERRAAMQLLQLNVEWKGNKLKLLNNEAFPVTVTPAITLILFNMLGVPARMMASWKSEEEVAALYAVRQWTLEKLESHMRTRLRSIQKELGRNDHMSLEEFEAQLVARGAFDSYREKRIVQEMSLALELKQLRFIRLQDRIQKNITSTKLPVVSGSTIMVNGEKASFADVIAPYSLFQTKHSVNSDGMVNVDIATELHKCFLFRKSDESLLRGLVAIWQGMFDDEPLLHHALAPELRPSTERRGTAEMQNSRAFPENLIKYRPAVDLVRHGEIDSSGTVVCDEHTYELPHIDPDLAISFILVTNVRVIRLNLPGEVKLDLSDDLLCSDMQVDETKLDGPTKGAWKILMSSLRDGVKMKFLFTRQT